MLTTEVLSRREKLHLRLLSALDKLNAEGRWVQWIEVSAAWIFWAEREGV